MSYADAFKLAALAAVAAWVLGVYLWSWYALLFGGWRWCRFQCVYPGSSLVFTGANLAMAIAALAWGVKFAADAGWW